MKKMLIGMSIIGGIFLLGACGKTATNEASWESIQEKQEIVMGLDDTFVPMGFKDEAGEIVGFDVDLAKAVFDQYGISVKLQPIDWSMKETELDNGTIDMIWNGYSKTAAREKKVLFSDTYMKNQQVLVSKKSSDVASFSDMEGKILGAQNSSSGYEAFNSQPEKLKDLVKDQDAVLYDSFNEAFIDLENDRIDGLLIDRVYANYYLNQNGKISDYSIMEGDFSNEDFAVGLRKADEELAVKINEGLAQLQTDGTFAEISEKWFGEDVTPK